MSFWNIFNKDKIISLNVDQDISNHSLTTKEYVEIGDIKEKVIGKNNYLVEYDLKDMLNPDIWISSITGEAFTEDEIMRIHGDNMVSKYSGNSLNNEFDLLLPHLDGIQMWNEDGELREDIFFQAPYDFGISLEKFEIKVGKGILINSFKLILTVDELETDYCIDVHFDDWLDASIKDFTTNRENVSGISFIFRLNHPQHKSGEFMYSITADITLTRITRIT